MRKLLCVFLAYFHATTVPHLYQSDKSLESRTLYDKWAFRASGEKNKLSLVYLHQRFNDNTKPPFVHKFASPSLSQLVLFCRFFQILFHNDGFFFLHLPARMMRKVYCLVTRYPFLGLSFIQSF